MSHQTFSERQASHQLLNDVWDLAGQRWGKRKGTGTKMKSIIVCCRDRQGRPSPPS